MRNSEICKVSFRIHHHSHRDLSTENSPKQKRSRQLQRSSRASSHESTVIRSLIWLVVSTPLKNSMQSVGITIPNVLNHQPVLICCWTHTKPHPIQPHCWKNTKHRSSAVCLGLPSLAPSSAGDICGKYMIRTRSNVFQTDKHTGKWH